MYYSYINCIINRSVTVGIITFCLCEKMKEMRGRRIRKSLSKRGRTNYTIRDEDLVICGHNVQNDFANVFYFLGIINVFVPQINVTFMLCKY